MKEKGKQKNKPDV